MINISNADRNKVVEFLRAYASMLQEQGMRSTTLYNKRRLALNLAKKLDSKKPFAVETRPDRKRITESDK